MRPRRGRAEGVQRRIRRLLALAVLGGVVYLYGCGAAINIPTIPKFHFGNPHGGTAAFDIDGTAFSVTQSGRVQANFPNAPRLTYSGPLGCKGHYFTTHYTEHIRVFFRYSSRNAYLLIDNGADPVYSLGAPKRSGKSLEWKRNVGDRQISVTVTCAD